MASPTRNFIDPTKLSGMQPLYTGPQPQAPTTPGGTWVWATEAWWRGSIITAIGGRQIPVALTPYQPEVPTPPMGRQLINTFPSIYKERTGNRPMEGQVWPRKVTSKV